MKSDNKFHLLADDLTGALDAGMALCVLDTVPKVFWDVSHIGMLTSQDTLIYNLESRNVSASEAVKSITSLQHRLNELSISIRYKKIDSTWRGNTSLELVTLKKQFRIPFLIVPALPSQNRITINGRIYIEGIPLHSSDFGRDPFGGVDSSSIPKLLSLFTDEDIVCLKPYDTKGLQNAIIEGKQWLVGDAVNESDLDYWAVSSESINILPCGSAGFYNAILREQKVDISESIPTPMNSSSLLIINGSPSMRTRDQISHAIKHFPRICYISVDLNTLFSANQNKEMDRILSQANSSLKAGFITLIDAASVPRDQLLHSVGGDFSTLSEQSKELQSALVKISHELHKPEFVVLIGGDTASAILRGNLAYGLEIVKPILPQIPLSIILGGYWAGSYVVTKAGGFGSTKDLIKLISKLKDQEKGWT